MMNKEDNDNDTLPDGWEIQHFGNLDENPYDDFDDDGLNNYQEYINKTDPTDPNDPMVEDDDDSSINWIFTIVVIISLILLTCLAIAIVIYKKINRNKADEKEIPKGV